jgi:N-acetylmuramoyl-L-alanine amidase
LKRRHWLLALVLVVAAPSWAAAATAQESGICSDGQPFLKVWPKKDDGYIVMSRRYTRQEDDWRRIRDVNRRSSVQLGRWVKIPLDLLTEKYRHRALMSVFPEDRFAGGYWMHPLGQKPARRCRETLENLSTWFTGSNRMEEDLGELNGRTRSGRATGRVVRIPREMLLPVFVPQEAVSAVELSYGEDEHGPYALYRLQPGEALYSSVVIRFTGNLDAQEVNQIVTEIAQRNNIRDVRSLPVGFAVRIPRELMLPRYLPQGDPRRAAWEASRSESSRFRTDVRARRLAGVHVILDAGHGGVDVGTTQHGMDEDEYVYDVMCRIKRRLDRDTDAMTLVTIEDRHTGYEARDLEILSRDRNEIIRTTPPYQPLDPDRRAMGVNLRWYLANSFYRRLVERGVDGDKIVFVSLHADSLHPSLRGAMAYIPGGKYRTRRYGNGNSLYSRFEEVRDQTYISFDAKARTRSEGVSRQFAEQLMRSFRNAGLPVHRYEPVRDHVIRRGRSWVPAVIRCSEVPLSLLLELVNLSNSEDRAHLRDPDFREQLARGFVDALLAYYRSDLQDVTASRLPATEAVAGQD